MGLVQGAIRIDCDSQSAISLAKKLAYHSKTKHIDVQYHFLRDMIEDKKVLLVLGCVIFFPRLAHIVNRGLEVGRS